MNPSRISTPVVKTIDEWWFQIDENQVVMDVTLHRPRDPQTTKHGVPKFRFKASLNTDQTRIEGKKLEKSTDYNEYFPTKTYEAGTLAELRDVVEKGLYDQVGFVWDNSIIIITGKRLSDETDRTPNAIRINLDFARCQCSKGKYWRSKPGEWISNNPRHLLDCTYDGEEVHTVPYNDELWDALQEIRARMIGLSDKLTTLLKPEQHKVLTAMMLGDHLLPPAS